MCLGSLMLLVSYCLFAWSLDSSDDDHALESYGTADADSSVEHSTVGQILGLSSHNELYMLS